MRAGKALAFIPVFAFIYVLLILPFISGGWQTRIENVLFWPTLAACVLAMVFVNRRWIDSGFFSSAPIASFIAYLILAAASITWAFAPDYSLSRYFLQLFVFIVVVVPYALPIDTSRTIQRLHVCGLIALSIHAIYVLTTPPSAIGHTGYLTQKQELGVLAGGVIILAAHELMFRGWRRWLAVVSIGLAYWLILESQSKSSLAFVLAAIGFGSFAFFACKLLKTTPAYIVGAVVAGFFAVSYIWSDPIGRIAWHLYGDMTLTGRTFIWEFIEAVISQRRWFGWGFHSYWAIPDSPHNNAPGFIKYMISTHSGYLELRLDTGRIGYVIFMVFIYASLHIIEPVRRKDPIRGWFFITMSSYILLINLVESIWLYAIPLWILYLIVVAESVHVARSQGSSAEATPAPMPIRSPMQPRRRV